MVLRTLKLLKKQGKEVQHWDIKPKKETASEIILQKDDAWATLLCMMQDSSFPRQNWVSQKMVGPHTCQTQQLLMFPRQKAFVSDMYTRSKK